MPSPRPRRIPVPLENREYDIVKMIGQIEDRPMAWVISRALTQWLHTHLADYPEVTEHTMQVNFALSSPQPLRVAEGVHETYEASKGGEVEGDDKL